jgi:signal transduction histidine kinase
LIPALRAHLNAFGQRTKIRIAFTAAAGIEPLSTARRTVIYRVVQAALTQAAQQAGATVIKVSLKLIQTTVHLHIHDNGQTAEVAPAPAGRPGKRLELLAMREWVENVGGHFSVVSAPGKGTTICVRMPVAEDGGMSGRRDTL